jgi:lipopolysaccharide biosynthesis protein
MKRLCLFAGYDAGGMIQDYVAHLLAGISRLSEVYCCFEVGSTIGAGVQKLGNLAKEVHFTNHGKYDFGSWSFLLSRIDDDTLAQCDELILMNDSIYGPLFDLGAVFSNMEAHDCDFWGMSSSQEVVPHLQSYFLVFRNRVLRDRSFRGFFACVEKERSKLDVVVKYEIGLSKTLTGLGYSYRSFWQSKSPGNPTKDWMQAVDSGVPFIKCSLLSNFQFSIESESIARMPDVCAESGYPFTLVDDHLRSKRLRFDQIVVRQLLFSRRLNVWREANYFYSAQKVAAKLLLSSLIASFNFGVLCLVRLRKLVSVPRSQDGQRDAAGIS